VRDIKSLRVETKEDTPNDGMFLFSFYNFLHTIELPCTSIFPLGYGCVAAVESLVVRAFLTEHVLFHANQHHLYVTKTQKLKPLFGFLNKKLLSIESL
jgi:hypothetical protein